MQFAWFKDNAPLKASPRLRTRYDAPTKQVLLQIDEVRPEDVGQYRVVAKNPAGEDSTTGSVGLLPEQPGKPDQAPVPPGKMRNLKTPEGQGKRPLEIVPGAPGQPIPTPEQLRGLKPIPTEAKPEDEVPEAKRPPRVIVPLSDGVVEEDMPIVLTTKIDAGVPMATVRYPYCLIRTTVFKSPSIVVCNHEKRSTIIRRQSIYHRIRYVC